MSRILTAAMAKALRSGAPRGLFVAIEHPDGTGYFCTGVGSRTWNGHTWASAGEFGKITPIKQSSEIAIEDITYTLSGIPSRLVEGLSDNVCNLNGSTWLACFHWDDSVVLDPFQLIDSELDYQVSTINDDGTATIDIIAHSGFYTLGRGVEEAWSASNQLLIDPTDTGMKYIASLQHQDLPWTPV